MEEQRVSVVDIGDIPSDGEIAGNPNKEGHHELLHHYWNVAWIGGKFCQTASSGGKRAVLHIADKK
ncbi:hypothetical protein DPPLL_23450 [Desulfofustis limnaeus]|uniref:Uncharacterized protein n=1 Tax=Desulfofustis limnaeus TaxID=2740163 RepID=A0ABM7WAI9_9BACT|nr:hypothetical protein DPPLL_23450 [Desulfofustis limnaeus]